MARNYHQEFLKLLKQLSLSEPPALLLHSCCAPCSSAVLELLSRYFSITVFYYNPGIAPEKEYRDRAEEQKRFIREFPFVNPVDFIEGTYEPEIFYALAKGLETEAEGGERCRRCFELRLRETARLAAALKKDYFATTLSISPLKNAEVLNALGEKIAAEFQTKYLPANFKKNGGYARSVALSAEYRLYRQNYCGCVFSRLNRKV
ncbi:MAG: epoxyqueuosine reductase QueH [Fibrobacter sp.]|jgi:predicted adenine nucleotide alpha hydrolase (AANH) superfamily ATPase|nr:epoxyqueuosine reductase QueH [Fibrobacter sp.]